MRYFFHIEDGTFAADTDGVEMLNLDQVKQEAARLISLTLTNSDKPFWNDPKRQLRVVDADGRSVLMLSLSGNLHPAHADTSRRSGF